MHIKAGEGKEGLEHILEENISPMGTSPMNRVAFNCMLLK